MDKVDERAGSGLVGRQVEDMLAGERLAVSRREQGPGCWSIQNGQNKKTARVKDHTRNRHPGSRKGGLGMPTLCPTWCVHVLSVLHSHRVKQSELFDRWKSLQMCRWAMNISEANQFKYL